MKIKSGKDFVFHLPKEGEENKGYYIELNSGKYEGVKFKYGQTAVEEDEEKGEAFLKFEYEVIDSNGKGDLENNEEFKNHIGNVLVSIIEENSKRDVNED